MLIKDMLKYNLITCNSNASIKDVSILMKDSDIGFIPVKDEDKFIGVVTDRDIVIRGCSSDINDISKIVSPNIISIDSNKNIYEALDYYVKYKIKRLLVTEDDKYVGVISINDIIKVEHDTKELIETIRKIFSIDNPDKNVEVDTFEL